jgi:hypothetical protein
MPEPLSESTTLTDEDIETRAVGDTAASRPVGTADDASDTTDTGDDSGDASDSTDTGDDSGDTSDASDASDSADS